MKAVLKQFKLYDVILVVLCIILSLVPLAIFTAQELGQNETVAKIAIIKIHGKEVDRFEIDKIDHFEKTYYPAKGQYNIIEIQKGRIRDKQDNSPDQIAVKTGWISKKGQTSICIPHDLVIEIVSNKNEDDAYPIY
ncbi:NusG domain II-containing protein [Enterococcus sp. DIV0086]|uniref:NusG domain II-containing protein n=1 Tax=Enterococcus sp. DIV0086 TaxID=2774655 RepID=UPI003D28F6D0